MICNECSKTYADSLSSCPYCGAKNIKNKNFFLLRWSDGAIITLISILGFLTSILLNKSIGIIMIAACILCSILHIIKLYQNTMFDKEDKIKLSQFLALCLKNEEPFTAKYDFVAIIFSIIAIIVASFINFSIL